MNRILAYGKSDVGLKRSNNEDSFLIRPELGFCLVADGMGGAAAGELASQIFSETALEVFSGSTVSSADEAALRVQHVFVLANERILAHVEENAEHKGMGCTAELIAFSNSDFVIGHIGDSRTYRLKDGRLKQLTQDHSLVQEQINKGILTPEEARQHAMRHMILRAVGVEQNLALDLVRGKAAPGDLFLLCSDGLTDMLEDLKIQETLVSLPSISQQTEELIHQAKAAGGHDNVTVVLVETP